MWINTPNENPEVPQAQPEAPKMPNDHPEKQGVFSGISDALRNFSEFLGFGEKNKPNELQNFFAKILSFFQWIDIEKGVTIQSSDDITKVREALRPILDLDETSIELKEWDFIRYNKELGTVDFYPTDANQKSGHSLTPSGIVPIDNPSERVQQEEKARAENPKEEPAIQGAKNHQLETAFSRLIWEKLRPQKSGPDSCGRAVRLILESFGMKNPPRWDWNQWYNMLKNDSRFEYVPVNSLSEIPAGAILTYSGKWKYNNKPTGSAMNQKHGHVEFKSASGLYTSFYASPTPGGSVFSTNKKKVPNTVPRSIMNDFDKWKEATGFTGAFIPLAKTKEEANRIRNSGELKAQSDTPPQKPNESRNNLNEKDFINSQLNILRQKGLEKWQQAIIVSVKSQNTYLVKEDGTILKQYISSTSSYGIGNESGSSKTPPGTLKINQKIGDGQPKMMSFKAREPNGIVPLATKDTDKDLITSRILTLSGMDAENKNAGQRHIYFHGTNEEFLLGKPSSHGCIRMKNDDIIEMFDLVSQWTLVQIA